MCNWLERKNKEHFFVWFWVLVVLFFVISNLKGVKNPPVTWCYNKATRQFLLILTLLGIKTNEIAKAVFDMTFFAWKLIFYYILWE